MPAEKPVGVIGVGLMGTACAGRLRGAGFEVLGYDVDPRKLDGLRSLGGRAAGSIAEIARECDQVVLAVFDTGQVEDAAEGLLAARPAHVPSRLPGEVERTALAVICVSTCDPDRIAALAGRLPPARLQFIESPVSGTSDQVARGDALGLVAGDRAAIEGARGVIEAIAPRWHHLGAAGNGGRAKLAINLILGINRAGLAEGLVFAERMGLPPDAFLAVARDSAAYSQVMDIKGRKMVGSEFSPQGYVHQSLKDFSLMLEQARKLKQQLPLGETYKSLMEGCVARGEAELDNSAVINEIRRRTSY
jgi:putative dehydrogenase